MNDDRTKTEQRKSRSLVLFNIIWNIVVHISPVHMMHMIVFYCFFFLSFFLPFFFNFTNERHDKCLVAWIVFMSIILWLTMNCLNQSYHTIPRLNVLQVYNPFICISSFIFFFFLFFCLKYACTYWMCSFV